MAPLSSCQILLSHHMKISLYLSRVRKRNNLRLNTVLAAAGERGGGDWDYRSQRIFTKFSQSRRRALLPTWGLLLVESTYTSLFAFKEEPSLWLFNLREGWLRALLGTNLLELFTLGPRAHQLGWISAGTFMWKYSEPRELTIRASVRNASIFKTPWRETNCCLIKRERDLSCLIGRQLAAAASILASDFSVWTTWPLASRELSPLCPRRWWSEVVERFATQERGKMIRLIG